MKAARYCLLGIALALLVAIPLAANAQLTTLSPNEERLADRQYRRAAGNLQIYNAPNGTLIEGIGAGYNYVTVQRFEGDWAQISQDQWVRTSQLVDDVPVSRFTGTIIEGITDQDFAWALINVHPSREPGGSPVNANPVVWRYNTVNILETTEVDSYTWYRVGEDQWIHQHHLARYQPVERPAGVMTDMWFSIDLYEQVLVAYEGETPVFSTLVSSGLPRWPTNEGLFQITMRFERKDMSGGVYGDDYYLLQEVPWTMYFDRGIALHGAFWHDNFGYRQSHGCVNLSITDAKFLFDWSAPEFEWTDDGNMGPFVYVYSSGEY